MKKVTLAQLEAILYEFQAINGMAIIATILQFTSAKLKKTGNPFVDTNKLTKLSVLLNTDYVKGVTNQLAREDKEASEYKQGANSMPLEFGTNNKFIGRFKGSSVIQYRPFDNSKPLVKYVHKSKIIDKAKIAAFLPSVSPATNQGTDKEILIRKVYLKNVRKMKFQGTTYKVIPDAIEA